MTQLPNGRGLLLPVTALAGGHGIGDFGPAARALVEQLAAGGYVAWQTLPLTAPGRGDSPYSTRSGNCLATVTISLDDLVEVGLLTGRETARVGRPEGPTQFAATAAAKQPLLQRAAQAYATEAPSRIEAELTPQRRDDARFAYNAQVHGSTNWWAWPSIHEPPSSWLLRAVALQSIAEQQWQRLRDCAGRAGVTIFGDLPLYVDHASADVWAHPNAFLLDEKGRMLAQAGVPPDAFSETGQLWRMPLYNWPHMKENNYRWWRQRLIAARRWFDLIRIDHFRGLAAYWASPGNATDARSGSWEQGPGTALLDAVGTDGMVAEDLGLIDESVRQLRDRHNLPGMHVLQFADPMDPHSPHHPSNHQRAGVAYVGTHDNPTALSWWYGLSHAERKDRHKAFGWAAPGDLLESLWCSPACLRVATAQDLLQLDDSARTNRPGTASGNWRWRLDSASNDALARRLVSSTTGR
jgi:4-alpha-glucanotransferase